MPFLRDRTGRFSAIRILALGVALMPAAILAYRWQIAQDLGPRPWTEAIHVSGLWAIRLLWLTLAVTPARKTFGWGKLIGARRTLGLASLAYASLHLVLYAFDQKLDLAKVASEIALRIYLTIGFVALLGLIALGVTSTDGAVRRLGARAWQRLHRIVYGIAALAAVHFFLQSKIDVTEAVLMAGLFVWLMAWRVMDKTLRPVGVAALLVLAAGSGLATAAIEALWYLLASGVDPKRVLAANLDVTFAIRPAWWVAGAGLLVAAAAAAFGAKPAQRRRTAEPASRAPRAEFG